MPRRAERAWVGRAALLAVLAAVAGFLLLGLLRPEAVLRGGYLVLGAALGIERHTVELEGRRIAVLEAGPADAPAIVLLHGFTGAKENWLPLMAVLARSHRVVAPDLPGWGESERVAGADHGVLAQAERVARWLRQRGEPPALLVGHSKGGHIAALVAARHPEQVPRLALIAAAGVPFAENAFAREVLAGGHPFAVDDRASLRHYLGLVFTDPPVLPWPLGRALIRQRIADAAFEHEVLATLRGPERFAVQPLLPDITAPTLLLWCDDDRVIDPSAADQFAAGLPRERVLRLPGCGHMPMLAALPATAAALREAAAASP
ncbi:alpha/beta fold hydrolase [Silanimonas sp.]|uniref:alpha/beta fold hydrolase n=1 Tax=Silanimonas sp. TaxID=1929290 RepID=UPI001BC34304|nr:alpha/beta fold hydrolase [Silanimonas sp.]MBS3896479.1 alpha/beta fold hydrolase [Silanimonas sp.]MBS3924437.1 alpha/beta fold hydrolase [Xanthomonadaceae bacterium]